MRREEMTCTRQSWTLSARRGMAHSGHRGVRDHGTAVPLRLTPRSGDAGQTTSDGRSSREVPLSDIRNRHARRGVQAFGAAMAAGLLLLALVLPALAAVGPTKLENPTVSPRSGTTASLSAVAT